MISETPFPGQDVNSYQSSKSVMSRPKSVYLPSSIQEQPLPQTVYANEVISQTLNTKSRKILAPLTFTQGGNVQTEEKTIADNKGLVSVNNFLSDNIVDDTTRSTTSSNVYVDLPNTTLSFSLEREAKVYLAFIARGHFINMENTDTMSGNIAMNIDGTNEDWPQTITLTAVDNVTLFSTTSITIPLAYMKIKTFSAGDHTIKLQFDQSGGSGDDAFEVLSTSVMYIVLGN